MRIKHLFPALILTAGLVLASCGDDGGDGDGGTEAAGGVTVSGEFGEKPTLEVPAGDPPAELEVTVLAEGDGPEVGADDFVVANYLGQTWEPRSPDELPEANPPAGEETTPAEDGATQTPENGETPTPESDDAASEAEPYIFDNSYDHGAAAGFSLNGVISGWKEGLAGQKVGSRVLLSIPPESGYGEQPEHDLAEDTLLFVVDIVEAVPADASATGEPVSDLPEGLPTVEGGETGVPTVTFDDAPEPKESDATVLLKGDGPELKENIIAQMMEAPYPNGEGAQSTWESGGPQQPIPVAGLQSLPGWSDVAEGLTVGSRVLVRVSSKDATPEGEDERPAVALILDILATY